MFDYQKPSFWQAVYCIVFNPLFWNIVARNEYRNKTLSKVLGQRNGCYVLAVTIFSLGIYRDIKYHQAIDDQAKYSILPFQLLGGVCFAIGNILVATSMYKLGVTGTYLGDYFGILMSEKVVGFPFSITSSPMYDGSTLVFLGTALWYGSKVGLLLTMLVYMCYQIALRLEDPFTAAIYAKNVKSTKMNNKKRD
eukprot:NODE_565_length_5974_cov_1.190468.p3 type:complete len:194 gc:universal NODE_565_length_5974_cov_1.190468:5119-5700(+)